MITRLADARFVIRHRTQVRKLIAGPDGVYICDECIDVCAEIIEEEDESRTVMPDGIR